MTVLALALLLLTAASPALLVALRRVVADPVLPAAGVAVVLLCLAAAVGARTDPAEGWQLAAALVLGVAAATTGGGLVVRSVFRLTRSEWRLARVPATAGVRLGPSATPGGEPGGAEAREAEAREPETVLRGGAWIGYLERAAVSATVLAGWPEGVALVLAVKGVGRYSELREANAPEAFIIGTLTSMLWAVAAAGAAHLLR